ncbi:hypothetical protein [Sphingobium limneticum]|uniref:Uncharacterized protein n=1 Tax=Sphingobium limneticum TaxID=1007511 RepID=A0A5J5I9C2_9SPHN|nr:hypothetical protein [Sphingobium limneticum]KAA9020743.1 hypothetical protein F4U96_03505 [Sphingobium limneticum]KAA9033069.1 hypothetical protein F4U95_03505 [Sphingobium limneticum]
MDRPIFNQNHSGSGNNVVNIGRQRFEVTATILNEILRSLKDNGFHHATFASIGGDASDRAVSAIREFLARNGVTSDLTVRAGIAMISGHQQLGPVEINGSHVSVNASL